MTQQLAIPEAQSLSEWTDRRLDTAIRRGHNACGRVMADYEHIATLTGVLLREKKQRLDHGEWLPWLENNFDGTRQTAASYMRMADERVPQMESALSISTPLELSSVATEDDEIVADEDIEVVEEQNGRPAYVEMSCPTCGGTGRITGGELWNA